MGFLVRQNFPAFTRAVISTWFRIPATLFTTMEAIPYPIDPDPSGLGRNDGLIAYYTPALYKIIPLMTFGSIVTDTINSGTCCPSFVGIDCFGVNTGTGLEKTLACNMQTAVDGSVVSDFPDSGPSRPGAFYVNGFDSPSSMNITPNAWHHALISFDISGSCSTVIVGEDLDPVYSSSCTFSWALDDVGKANDTLGPSGNYPDNGLGSGGIVTNWQFVGPSNSGDSSSFSGGSIASGDFCIPSGTAFSDKVRQIEMAKLQVFTGVTMNTGLLGNRRAFITADRHPASRSAGAALIGKAPEIHFDTKDDWIDGHNRGSGGNFTKTGTISPYAGTVGF